MVKGDLENAYALVKKGNSNAAIDICDRLLREHPDAKIEILRKRSHINAYINNLDSALSDRLEVITIGSDNVQDYFFAGVYSLELHKYNESIGLFGTSIVQSEQDNDFRYLEESYLLRAYAYLGVGKLKRALNDCEHVREDIEYFIEGDGPISTKRLVSYISKLSRNKGDAT